MVGLTKLVRDRLRLTSTSTDHPDANLLAGFAEHSLTSRERSLVLGHLGDCAECRQQVSMALPKLEVNIPRPGAATRCWPAWMRWPVLRWGLLMASLGIMGTVALVRQPPLGRMELAPHAGQRAVSLPSDVTIGAAPRPGVAAGAHRPHERAGELALQLAQTKKRESRELRQMQLAMRTPQTAGTSETRPSASGSEARTPVSELAKAFEAGSSAAAAASLNPSPGAIAAQPLAASRPPMTTTPGQEQSSPQGVAHFANAQPKRVPSTSSPAADTRSLVGGTAGGAVGGLVQPPASGPAAIQLAFSPAAAKAAKPATSPPRLAAVPSSSWPGTEPMPFNPLDWSISPSGRVQRSKDGRKTWEELDVDKGVVFRAVFAEGPHVWLGGTKGALYHSTDGGQHWTPVSITADSATVTDDVVRISFKDPQHGTVKTASGDTWTTPDGGQHWEKK
jgi:photosynthesis system II assembly factor YCF48-like protein